MDTVTGMDLPRGITTSLLAKLESALRHLNDDNDHNAASAYGALRAFIRAVQAQENKKISNEIAAEFVTTAQHVLERLDDTLASPTGIGIFTLCPDCPCALHVKGNVDFILSSAEGYDGQTAIQVNSEDGDAMCCDGGSLTVNAPETNIVGDAHNKCYSVGLETYIEADSPEIPDPLKDLEPPPCGSLIVPSVTTDPTKWNQPGYYPNGIQLNNSDQVANLLPGIYCVDGVGLDVRGGTLNAEGVMFYVLDSTPTDKEESHVYLGGNAVINITPSDNESDPYWGISIFQARDNDNEATIIGTGDMNLDGTLYFPVAPLEVGGEGFSLGNQLISWTLLMHGNGTFNVEYDGRFPALQGICIQD